MSMTRTLSLVALAALFVLAAIAASNPKVEPPECEGTEVETCEVDGPSAGSVAATADCTNFTFRLSGVVGGSERVVRKEEYSGGEDCMEPKTLSDETKNLAAQVSWEVVSSNASGVARSSGSASDNVEYLTKKRDKAEAADTEEDCYYVTEEGGVPVVVIRSRNFDNTTYGLCVSPLAQTLDNEITSFVITPWTYGETPVPATATARYGTPVITYYVNGEWVLDLPVNAGQYEVRAHVEATEEYKGADASDYLLISKAEISLEGIAFEDLTVEYDGDVHSVRVTGTLPAGVSVQYENNAKVDVGEYTVKAKFIVGDNYLPLDDMTATLRITEPTSSTCYCWIFWLLLAIAIAETAVLVFLIVKGRKDKKDDKGKRSDDKTDAAACCISLCTLGKVFIAINVVLGVIDIALLILIILKIRKNKQDKKGE